MAANKATSIKNATDKELDDLLIRLRKENELQDLARNLKRKSTPHTTDPYGNSIDYDRHGISTEEPIETLYHKEDVENTLKHFGILGMRWGVRRGGGATAVARARAGKGDDDSDDYKNTHTLKGRNIRNLSTKDLQEITKRLQLEKQLRELKTNEYKRGLDYIKSVTDAGKTISELYNLAKSPMVQAIAAKFKKKS